MTRAQFEQLGGLITAAHTDTKEFQKLLHAAASIDRCDGLLPEQVRLWIRALDGWQSEAVSDDFMLGLAKATATGDLLEEIRSHVNAEAPHNIEDWESLREHVMNHFLSACETIKLQTKLETIKQRSGETTPTYIRRFRADASRAYGTTPRAPTEAQAAVTLRSR
jgi:hypothetical protein